MRASTLQSAGVCADGRVLAATARWMVLHTRPRQEKAVARYLDAVGADHYLPLVERIHFVRGRKTASHVPLFPGYVFMAGQLSDAYDAIKTKRVCQIIRIPDQEQFVAEIEQIRDSLAGGARLELYPFAVVGQACRVTRGPFLGVQGVITDRLGPNRLVLQVAILSQGAALEIDIDVLEPLTDRDWRA